MSLSNSEKREIETLIRKEIRIFMENNTVKRFEDKILDRISKEMKKGRLETDIKDITVKMFREFYQFMWNNKSQWETKLKNS